MANRTPKYLEQDPDGNAPIGGGDPAGGQGCIPLADCTQAPTDVPVGGGVLYVQDGKLKFKGPDGNVTILAPA